MYVIFYKEGEQYTYPEFFSHRFHHIHIESRTTFYGV